ncbi:MAG TPA: hypothetical protein VN132_01720 [Bdellovibrio sp.]|nr:hypothetical protein [Bdellovibrio sp.]
MRKLIIFLCLALSSNALAFSDLVTHKEVDKTIEAMKKANSVSDKINLLNGLKDFMFQRLNTIVVPDTTPKSGELTAAQKEYASLVEFDTNLNEIFHNIRSLNKITCANNRLHLQAFNANAETVSFTSEQHLVSEIIDSICPQ